MRKSSKPTAGGSAAEILLFAAVKEGEGDDVSDTIQVEKTCYPATLNDNKKIVYSWEYEGTAPGSYSIIYKNSKLTCPHENTTTFDAVTANCIAGGYTGDTYCFDCETIIATGETTLIDPDNHVGKAVVDPATVVIATCLSGGYTGDYYCESCGELVILGENTDIDLSKHIGMDDFTCDLCGYVDEAAAAAAALAAAKTTAKAAVNALASDDDSAAVTAIIEKALADIETADNITDVENIAAAAETDVAGQRAAEALAAAKTAAIAAINNAKVDASASIAEQAIADIENATTEAAVDSIKAQALSKMAAAKTLAEAKTNAKTRLNAALAEAKCDEAKKILNDALALVDSQTTTDAVASVYSPALSQAAGKNGEYTGKQNSYLATFNIEKYTGTHTEECTAFFNSVYESLAAAPSIAVLDAVFNANTPLISYTLTKDTRTINYQSVIDSDTATDDEKADAAYYLSLITAAKNMNELNAAINEITFHQTKKAALALINDVLDEYGKYDSVKALAEAAKADVNDVDTAEAILSIESEFTVAYTLQVDKEETNAALLALAPANASDAVMAIINAAIDEVNGSDTADGFETILADTEKAVAQQLADEAAAALAAAKKDAKETVEALADDDASDEVKAIVAKAIEDIDAAGTIDEVNAVVEAAKKAVADQKAAEALAKAKADAKTAVEALAGDDASDEVKAIITKALADIEKAENIAAVEDIVAAAEKAVADQKAAEEAAAALAAAKVEAKAAIEAAIEADDNDDVKAAAEEAKAAIDAATTVEEVEAAKNAGLKKMEDARGRCPYCGQKEHKNFIDKLSCIIKRFIKLIAMVFDFGEEIKAL